MTFSIFLSLKLFKRFQFLLLCSCYDRATVEHRIKEKQKSERIWVDLAIYILQFLVTLRKNNGNDEGTKCKARQEESTRIGDDPKLYLSHVKQLVLVVK